MKIYSATTWARRSPRSSPPPLTPPRGLALYEEALSFDAPADRPGPRRSRSRPPHQSQPHPRQAGPHPRPTSAPAWPPGVEVRSRGTDGEQRMGTPLGPGARGHPPWDPGLDDRPAPHPPQVRGGRRPADRNVQELLVRQAIPWRLGSSCAANPATREHAAGPGRAPARPARTARPALPSTAPRPGCRLPSPPVRRSPPRLCTFRRYPHRTKAGGKPSPGPCRQPCPVQHVPPYRPPLHGHGGAPPPGESPGRTRTSGLYPHITKSGRAGG